VASRPRSSSYTSYSNPGTDAAAAAISECLSCRDSFRIDEAGSYEVTAYFSIDGIRISNISRREIILRRPLFDVKKVLVQKNRPFQFKPVVDVFVVSKDLTSPASPAYCAPPKRVVPGHHIVLHNPLGHVDFLEPAARCGGGLSLPSDTSRNFSIQTARLDYSRSPSYASVLSRMSPGDIDLWRAHHESSLESGGSSGCSVVTNGGFFDIQNFNCFGNLVSGGRVVQVSNRHNVNFGIRDGSFHVGYIDLGAAAAGSESHFDTLISGLGWLVRNGRSYVSESLQSAAAGGDGEDMSAQSNGPAFASILSARTAIGYDSEGRLMLLQVEGESFVRGMSLYEFADFLVELGFESAINLDGGGSATVTARNELVTEPSWRCSSEGVLASLAVHDDDVVPRDRLPPGAEYRVCEKPVSSVMCIHALPPPSSQELEHLGISPASISSAAPSGSPPSPMPSPMPSATAPSVAPSDHNPAIAPPEIEDDCQASAKACADENLSMRSSLLIYRTSTFFLAIILVLSLTVNGWWMINFRAERDLSRTQRGPRPPNPWSDHRVLSSGSVEMHRPPARGSDPEVGGRPRNGDVEVGGSKHLLGEGEGSASSEEEEDEGSDEDDETSSLTRSPVRASQRSVAVPSPLSLSAPGRRVGGSVNPFSKRKF
jgi:hypothetical protein